MADSQLLAPWEYEGEIPQIVESGELVWQGRPVRFELLQNEQYKEFGVRDLKISFFGDDGSWDVVLSDLRYGAQEIREHDFAESVKRGRVRRQFYLDSEVLRVKPNGTGYWYQNHEVMSDFHLGRGILDLTSSQTHELILGLLAKPNSDVAYALRFKKLEHEQKQMRIFGVSTAKALGQLREEMGRLCRLILYSDTTIWHRRTGFSWSLVPSLEQRHAYFLSWRLPSNELNSQRLNHWAMTLEEFGPIHLNLKRLCVRQQFNVSTVLAKGHLASPSAHEQLEARFELHAWGREYLPPTVWSELEQFDAR